MKKTVAKRISAIIILAICISISYIFFAELTQMKSCDGIRNMQDFYVQKDSTVDILILGSSHAGQNIDLALLWDNFGYSGFDIWGGDQSLADSYYHLEEALKYQRPKLVILEAHEVFVQGEYNSGYSWYRNLSGMRFSLSKIREIMNVMPYIHWADVLFKLPVYHERITDLSQDDYEFYKRDISNKGFSPLGIDNSIHYSAETDLSQLGFKEESGTGSMIFRPYYDIPVVDLHPKAEYYYRKIIEKCKAEDIRIMVTISPFPSADDSDTYSKYKRAGEIAGEYGVLFVDYNDPQNDLKLTDKDFPDTSHLNILSARKMTDDMGKRIASNYNLPDHRGDVEYSSWDDFASQKKQEYLTQITRYDEYMEEVRRDKYFVTRTVCAGGRHRFTATDYSLDGIEHDIAINRQENKYFYEYDGHIFGTDIDRDNMRAIITFDGDDVKALKEPAEVYMVYDKTSKTLVDTVTLYGWKDNGSLDRE